MQSLAITRQVRGSRTAGKAGMALLAKAVRAFRATPVVRTRAVHPVDWATSMQDLAVALVTQGSCPERRHGAAV